MDERWKDAVASLDEKVADACAKIVCEQTNCSERGFDEKDCGNCAFCADTAESVIGTFLIASGQWP